MENISYILYTRKSSESEDRQIQSVEDQVKIMTEFAEQRGLRIVKTLRESHSAKTPFLRPEFTKVLGMIESGQANGILCWQLNRLSRNPAESGILQQMLQDKKLLCIQTNDRVYLPEDNAIVFSVDAGMSNQFVLDLMKNVRRGMHSKAEKGWLPGVPPVGYKNDRENRTIINDTERYILVRKMWDLMLTGTYTIKQIADIAEHEWGLKTIKRKKRGNKPLSYSGVYNMFHNPFYKGVVAYGGKEYPGKHGAMVSELEFDRVQQLIHTDLSPRPKDDYIFAFRGLLVCGECGCRIVPQHSVKHQKNGVLREYDYYRCSLRKKGYVCSQRRYVREDELGKQIKNELPKYTIVPHFYDLAVRALQELDDDKIAEQTKIADSQHSGDKTAKETEIRELGRMRYRGECPDDEFYTSEKKKLEKELRLLKKARTSAERRAANWRVKADETFSFARYAKEDFDSDDLENKRKVLASLGQNLQLLDGKIQFTPMKYLVPVVREYPDLLAKWASVRDAPQQIRDRVESEVVSAWYTRQDSNLRPSVPKTDALIR